MEHSGCEADSTSHGRETRPWFEAAESLYRPSGTYDAQNRVIYQDITRPEGKMMSRINRSSESFPLEDAGLIRRNWRVVGLRVIFGLFWAADAYLKWSLIAHGIDYRDIVSSAAEGQPSTVASWKDLGGYCKFYSRLPLRNSHNRNRHCHIHYHRTLHKTHLVSGNCLQLPHLEHRGSFQWSLHSRRHGYWNRPPLHGHVRRAHSRPRWNATRSGQTHPKEISPPQPFVMNLQHFLYPNFC